jgi:hypothetical protein
MRQHFDSLDAHVFFSNGSFGFSFSIFLCCALTNAGLAAVQTAI